MKKRTLILTFSLITLLALNQSCKKDSDVTTKDLPCTGGDGILSNVAGIAGNAGGAGNGGSALNATLYWPQDVNIDKAGNILIVDWNNHCVRKVSLDGNMTILIGSGYLGDGATIGSASNTVLLNHPSDITFDADGNYWLTAWHNWKLKEFDHTNVNLISVLGTSQGFSGNNGIGDTAKMNFPSSLVFDESGNLYFSDAGNQQIRRVDAVTKIVTTFAGSTVKGYADGIGEAAQFSMPTGTSAVPGGKLAVSNDKQWLYCADTENNRIRKISLTTGEVTTIAGTGVAGLDGDGNLATLAQLNYPTDVAIGPDNAIYIADSHNHTIRKIDSNGVITTVAGTPGVSGYSSNCIDAKSAKLYNPSGVYVSTDNTLYIADTYNHQVKKVKNP
jgi:sugar lactone lactonase YvrE